ncbi:SusC/RagA family TonB-linked outer membrane protein [Pedobacter sp. HMWF019]|uniref:SusC/RagA family TonB-linked outer membrane protein n=1 Tax=Pedobacter sp. HMWF019 TaxID=2056856 RepID=UPI001E2C17FC|nr:SusC/RagA family TonB-linked outer membrane protein [Pedobacter sp. HMWF019]
MKNIWFLTILVLLKLSFCSLKTQAQITNKKIPFEAEGIMLKNAFQQVEKLSGVSINYNNTQLNDKRMISGIAKAERSVQEILNLLLRGTVFTFKASDDGNILIVPKPQEKGKIRGKVLDDQGEPLPGASVKIVKANVSAQCQNDGSYVLNVTPGIYTVEISFISFEALKKENIIVQANSTTTLNVQLKAAPNALNEVVVTALGIKREEKSLGYAVSTVRGEQLTGAISNNWTDALSGKVAGLNLVRSNSGPTGSNKIILRGENNLTGDNEALIVIDGVVISQGSGRRTANGGESAYGTSSDMMPADYGSGINDINPEDIESVSVLKGPGASALYGQRGANGAILITTKSGSAKKKGIGITINSNVAFEEPNRWPDLQYEYGQGTAGSNYYSYGNSADGASTSGTSSAYGPKFDGQSFFQLDPLTQTQGATRTPWVPYKNQIRKFFDVGQTYTNSVSIDGGSDKTTARFSATNVNNNWIIPNTGYQRNSVALSVNSKINEKLTISSKINYNNKSSDNLPGAGYGNQSIMYWFIFWQPNADINWLKNYWKNGQENKVIFYPYSSYPENPYAVSYEFINKSSRNSFTGNVQAAYDITKELSLQLRTSMDFGYEQRAQQRPYDAGTKYPKGSYRTQNIFSQEVSGDFLLKYHKKLNRDFTVTATGGGSMLRNNYNKDEVRADSLVYAGSYKMSNSAGPLVTLPYKATYALNSFYGLLSTSFRDYLYMDITARKDYASTLATAERTDNAGFFYPSLSMSFLPSQLFKLPRQIDYAKLRASVASVGSGGIDPYQTIFNYVSAGSIYSGGLQNPGLLTNPNLRPLRTITFEVGAEMKFFKSRLGFDLALYSGNTKDQILKRIIDRSSGFSQAVINAGRVSNKGLELALNGVPVRLRNGFEWSVNMTFSANKNTIKALADSAVVLQNGPTGGGQIVAQVGGSMGDMYGRGYLRAPDGQIVYDAKTGFAKLSDDLVYLGNTIPKWKTSMSHDFKYKQFRLNVLFDAQYGGVAYSLTNYKLAEQGKTTNTLPGRYNGIIGNGVVQNADGTYRKNDVIASDVDGYYRSHYGIDNAEGNTFSTNFIKFREARLDYTLNPKFSKRLGMQRATVGVYGRNLYIWSNWPIFDPEFGTLSGSDITQGFEIAQFPSTRTFGFNLVIGL